MRRFCSVDKSNGKDFKESDVCLEVKIAILWVRSKVSIAHIHSTHFSYKKNISWLNPFPPVMLLLVEAKHTTHHIFDGKSTLRQILESILLSCIQNIDVDQYDTFSRSTQPIL